MKELELYARHLQEDRDLTPASLHNNLANLQMFFDWFEQTTGQSGAASVTPLDIKQYREHIKAACKPATVNKKLSYLSGFFRWCAAAGLTDGDVTARVKRVKAAPKAPKWLDRQQTYKVLRQADQAIQLARVKGLTATEITATRTAAIVRLTLNSGVRLSELCDLRLGDVHLRAKSGLLVVKWGKGSKRREIPLNNDAVRAVSDWLKVRPDGGDHLFTTNGGKRMSRQLVEWHLQQLGKKAGVRLTPHVLRHCFCKSLVDSGVQLDRVAILAGHSSVNTTAAYTMPGARDLERAVERIAWEE